MKHIYINDELNIINENNFDDTIEEYMGTDSKNLYLEQLESLTVAKEYEERRGDEYYQILTQTINEVRELKRYLKDTKRMNREKLIDMVLALENTIENY
jgi:hypothetical protein